MVAGAHVAVASWPPSEPKARKNKTSAWRPKLRRRPDLPTMATHSEVGLAVCLTANASSGE